MLLVRVIITTKIMIKNDSGYNLKSDSYHPKCVICAIESPLKMMNNAFYFILNALKFLSWLFGHIRKTAWLER